MSAAARFWFAAFRHFVANAYGRTRSQLVALLLTATVASLLLPGPWDASRAEAAKERPPAELVELRSAKTKTMREPDGRLKTTLSEQSLHYLDADAKWREIDATFKASEKANTKWESGENRFSVEIAETAKDGFVRLGSSGAELSLSLEEGDAVRGVKAKKNSIVFKDALKDVDLEYVVLPDGLKENIVLRRPGAPSKYTFRLEPAAGDELRHEEREDGSVWFSQEGSSEPAFVLLPPVVGDSSDQAEAQPDSAPEGPPSWAAARGKASMDVEAKDGGFLVTLSIDEDWLEDSERVYPVVLDPTLYVQPDTADGDYDTTNGGTPNVLAPEIRTGRDGAGGAKYASVLNFDLATIPPAAKVLEASLYLHLNACFPTACGAGHTGDVELRRLTSGWSPSTPWSAVTKDAALQDKISFTTTPPVTFQRWSSGAFTQTVQAMVNGTTANHGFILEKAGGNDAVGYKWRSTRYSDLAFGPYMDVYWIADGVQVSPATHLHADGAELFWQHYAGGTSAYADAVFQDSPVGYWRLDEAAGDLTARDWSGNGGIASVQNPTGVVRGEPSTLADANTSTKLLGTPAGYVKVPDDPVIRVNDSFTLEAWVRRLDLTPRAMAIFNDFGSGFWLQLRGDNKLDLSANNGGASIVSSTQTISDTNWHHVAATKAGSTVKLYIDGTDVTGTVTNHTLVSSTQGFHVGNSDGLTNPHFGWIDEAALYPAALSSARIQAHYSAGSTAMPGFQRFEIHRSATPGFTPSAATHIGTVADAAIQHYRDTTAKSSSTFYYDVVTITDEGSFSSNELKADLPAPGLGQVTIQPGQLSSAASGTHISSGSPTTPAGNSQSLVVGSSGSNHTRTLLSFDTRLVPTDATISSAKLHLYAFHTTPATNLHRVSAQWWEGGATWNHRESDSGLPWSSVGGDFDSTPAGSSSGGQHQHWDTWEFGSLLQQWVNGTSAHQGVLLKYGSENGSQPTLSYAADGFWRSIALRPKLVISYEDGSQAVTPTVALSQPAADELVKGELTVKAGALDDGHVSKVEFFLDGNALGSPDTTSPFEVSWNTASASRGEHTLTAKATDDAGNETTSEEVSVLVANSSAPTTSVTSATAGGGGVWTVNASASDDVGVERVEFYVDGDRFASDSSSPYSATLATLTFPTYDGAWTLTTKAYDEDENVTTSAAHPITVANTSGTKYKASIGGGAGGGSAQIAHVRRFDGVDDVIRLAPDPFLSPIGDMTFAVIFKPRVDVRQPLINIGGGSGGRWSFWVYADATTKLLTFWNGVTDPASSNNFVLASMGWTLLAMTKPDGTSTARWHRYRFDTQTWTHEDDNVLSAEGSAPAGAATLRLGGGSADNADGDYAVAGVWNDVLSDTQLETLVGGVSDWEALDPTSLWLLDQPSVSDPVLDRIANADQTSITGTTAVPISNLDFEVGANAGGGVAGVPSEMTFDPEGGTQAGAPVSVSLTNTSTVSWPTVSTKLRYRWLSADSTPVVTDSADVSIGADLGASQQRDVSLVVDPPALPTGVYRARYRLQIDLFDTAASTYFAAKGNQPFETWVTVTREISDELGLERYHQYDGEDLGGGFGHALNLANGNNTVQWVPFSQPGRGQNTVVTLTYNSLEHGSVSPLGNNWSLAISSLTPLGLPLDVHPNAADTEAGRTQKWVGFTDADGSYHVFTGNAADTYYTAPPGVHLYLKKLASGWELWKPDRTKFVYGELGFPTGVEDASGNALTFTLATPAAGEDAYGLQKRVTAVTDAGGRDFTLTYYSKAETPTPAMRGKLKRLVDHVGHALEFTYYEDGNLRSIREEGGPGDDGMPTPDREVFLTYTTPAGSGPAIASLAARKNPDPATVQSPKLYSLIDFRGNETAFGYSTAADAKKWRLTSRTNRAGNETTFAYDTTARTTTATMPLSRVWTYSFDTEGRVTQIDDPVNTAHTTVEWADTTAPDEGTNTVRKVTAPSGEFVEYAYNANGYKTSEWDELRHRTTFEYENLPVDANDVEANWGGSGGGGGPTTPTFVGAGAGAAITTTTGTVEKTSCTAGNLIILQTAMDAFNGWVYPSNVTNIEKLDGTDGAFNQLVTWQLGSSVEGTTDLWFGRVIANGPCSAVLNRTAGSDHMFGRIYEFSGAATGTALADVVEDGLSTYDAGHGTGTALVDESVLATGGTRLAVSMIALGDDVSVPAFTGETGGDWTEPVEEFASATGTQATLAIQVAPQSSGTIDGGTLTVSGSAHWGIVAFALKPGPGRGGGGGGVQSDRAIPHLSQLTAVVQPRGNATTGNPDDYRWEFANTGAGLVDTVTDPLGNVTDNDWNANGTLASQTLPANGDGITRTTSYDSYDLNGLPTQMTDAAGGVTKAGYAANGNLVWLHDPNHAEYSGAIAAEYRTEHHHDAYGRPVSSSQPKSTAFARGTLVWEGTAYDANDNEVATLAAHYGRGDGRDGAATATTYDAMDRPTLVAGPRAEDDGGPTSTRTHYDDAGRVVKVTEPKGVNTSPSGSAWEKDHMTETVYDLVDREKSLTQYAVDSSGNVDNAATRTTNYCYDDAGDLRSLTGPKGASSFAACPNPAAMPYVYTTATHTTKFEYDDAHRQVKQTDALVQEAETGYDENGQVTSQTDALDKVTQFVYDDRGLQAKMVDPFDTGRTLTTISEYDALGNLKRLISPRAFDAAGGQAPYTNFVESYSYDALERLVTTTLPSDGSTPQAYRHQAYDANGNTLWTSLATTAPTPGAVTEQERTTLSYLDTGEIRTSQDPANPKVRFEYTAEGWQSLRIPEIVASPGHLNYSEQMAWQYLPDGLLRAHVDQERQRALYAYDANGNRTQAKEATGIVWPGQTPLTIDLSYNSLGELSKVKTPKPGAAGTYLATTLAYDLHGNTAELVDNHEENGAGTQTAAGRIFQYTFDAIDQPTVQMDDFATAGTTDDEQLTYTYRATGELDTQTLKKRPSGSWVDEQSSARTYFENGLLRTLVNKNGVGTTIESHTLAYIVGGVYLNGNRVSDEFQLKGPDAAAACHAATCTASWTYDARERVTQEVDGTGKTTSFTLDVQGNVTSDQQTGQPSVARTYAGQQLQSEDFSSGQDKRYVYDAFGSIDCIVKLTYVGANCPASGAGDLLEDYIFDYQSRLMGYRGYNESGGLTKSSDYTSDPLDRPVRQVETIAGTTTTYDFTYVGVTSALSKEVLSGATNTTKRYAYDAFGNRATIADGSNRYGYLYDPHGSVSLLLDQSSTVKESYGYAAYGASNAALTKTAAGFSSKTNPYRYTGKRLDSGSGTYDMGARRYSASTGRFLQFDMYDQALDNLGLSESPLTQNRYALAGGNPITFVEVDGHRVDLGDQGAAKLLTYGDLAQAQVDSANALGCRDSEQTFAGANCQALFAASAHAHKTEILVKQNPSLKGALTAACAFFKLCSSSLAAYYIARGDLTAAATVFVTGRTKVGKAGGRTKPVNLPGWKKVKIDLDHIKSGHTAGGSRVSDAKTLFSEGMTDRQLTRTIRQAYRHSTRVKSQGDRVLVRGKYGDSTIMIWVNRKTKSIESAYPLR